MTRLLPLLLLLSACEEFPALDARVTEAERAAPPPPLLPLTGLLAAAQTVPQTPDFAPTLSARAEALSVRASGLPAAGGTDAERLAALEARAEALRDGVLTEAERERLEAGPSLP